MPGDLGLPIVSREKQLGVNPVSGSFGESDAEHAEHLRQAQLAQQAREAKVMFQASGAGHAEGAIPIPQLFGLLLAVAGIGAACALIYTAAVYAVPLAVGIWVGFAALHAGSGPLLAIAIAIGFVTGAIVFGVGQSICASNLPRALRYVVVLVFVVPAVWTGYSATQQIAELFGPANPWTTCLSIFGAVAVGIAAFARLAGVPASDELHFRSVAIEPSPQRPLR